MMPPTITSVAEAAATAVDGLGFEDVLQLTVAYAWLLTCALAADPATGSLSGVVTDEETGAYLPGVTIVARLGDKEQAELTGDDGHYLLDGLEAGTYSISFYFANKRVQRDGVTIVAGVVTTLSVKQPGGPPYPRVTMSALPDEISRCEEYVPPAALRDRPLGTPAEAGFFEATPRAQAPMRSLPDQLAVHLRVPQHIGAGKSFMPSLTVTNRDRQPVVMLKVLDASPRHYRHPQVHWYARNEATGMTYRWAGSASPPPTINKRDYLTVVPHRETAFGAEASLGGGPMRINVPGRYRVWAVYQFCGYAPRENYANPNAETTSDWEERAVVVGTYASEAQPILVAGLPKSVQSPSTNQLTRTLQSVAFRSDGRLLVGGGADGVLRVWDVTTGVLVKELHAERAVQVVPFESVAISSDGRFAAAGRSDGAILVWDLQAGTVRAFGREGVVRRLEFASDGSLLLSSGDEANVWEPSTGRRRVTLDVDRRADTVHALFDATGHAVYGFSDRQVKVFDAMTGHVREGTVTEMSGVAERESGAKTPGAPDGPPAIDEGDYSAIAVSRTGIVLSDSLLLFDIRARRSTRRLQLPAHADRSGPAVFDDHGRRVLLQVSTPDDRWAVLDCAKGNTLMELRVADVTAPPTFTRDGLAVALPIRGGVRLVTATTGEEIRTLALPATSTGDTFHVTRKALAAQGVVRSAPRLPVNCSARSAELACRTPFFPPQTFDSRDDRFVRRWYSEALTAFEEPSLARGDPTSTEVYRLVWLRSFEHPVAVRLEHTQSGGRMITKVLGGAGGYAPGKIIDQHERNLSEEEWLEVIRLVKRAGFWGLPTRDQRLGLDGAEWILEGAAARSVHVVDRWSPEVGDYREACLFLLRLSGVNLSPLY
jgi:hypothetical protein